MITCPHDRSLVLETRTVDSQVYRRRRCRACHNNFVTLEVHGVEQPAASIPRPRTQEQRDRENARRRRAAAATTHDGPPRGDGAHLQHLWR